MGNAPSSDGDGGGHRGRPRHNSNLYMHSTAHIFTEPRGSAAHVERQLERLPIEREHHERHERCWTCLVWCICSGHAVSEEHKDQERSVIRHLALISAEYFHASPGCFSWVWGLRAIKKETKGEDEAAFLERAPERSHWAEEHFVLDLGVSLPSGSSASSASSAGPQVPSPLAEVARAAAHFAAFATAAYALKLQVMVDPGRVCLSLPLCRTSSKRAFCEMAGIAQEHVLHAIERGRPFKPSWWLCLDHTSRAVVVAVRGTFGPADLLSDALAQQVHHGEHVLYEGMLASAKWLVAKLRPLLEGLQELRSGDFRLVLTGHSLGGAVAAIATWLLRTEDGPGGCYMAQCFTYGAPHVVDAKLAKLMERFVVGIVHHNDMIPRLGRKTLEDLRDRVKEVTRSAAERLARLEAVLTDLGLPTTPEPLREALERRQQGETLQRARIHSDPYHDPAEDVWELPALRMFNPGWQLQLQRRGVRWRAWELVPVVSRRVAGCMLIAGRTPPRDYMNVIRPCLTMWTDHWPQGYQYVCEVFADRLEAKSTTGRPELSEVLRKLAIYLEGDAIV